MQWLIFALVSAIFASAALLIEKKILAREHAMEFSASLAFFNLMLSIPFLLFIDYSKLQITPLVYIFFLMIVVATAFLLVAKSIRHMELSTVAPLTVLIPAVTAILAFVFLNEKLGSMQISGIVLIMAGAYILELHRGHNFLEPFKIIAKSKYFHFIFLGVTLYGVAAFFDRVILSNYDIRPISYMVFANIFLAFHFFVMMSFFHDGFRGLRKGLRRFGLLLLPISIFTIIYRLAFFEALKIEYAGLVVSVQKMSVLFAVIIGGELFREKNILRKSIASLIMLAGILFIVL